VRRPLPDERALGARTPALAARRGAPRLLAAALGAAPLAAPAQLPRTGARSAPTVEQGGLRFTALNRSGALDP
jgi:hypothetical protein